MARLVLIGVASAILALGVLPTPLARAALEYPWCAEYRWPMSATNCGFNTYQQCLATISGIGGYCYRNPAYPDRPPQRRTRSRAQ